jgi:hypothetical protein
MTIAMYRKWVIVEWRAEWFTPEAGSVLDLFSERNCLTHVHRNMVGYETLNTEYTSDDEDTSG